MHILHQIRPYSSFKIIEGRVTPVNLRILEKSGYQCPEFFRMVQFCYLYIRSGTFLSIMGPINYFDQVVQEILQNSYLKNNFENSKISDFVSTL